jgi:carboxypeptidase family protein
MNKLSFVIRVLSGATLSVFLFSSLAFGQALNTKLNGTVKDPNGAAVSGATVTLTDTATNRQVTTTTNDDGFYVFPELRAGTYNLRAEGAGFKKTEVLSVQVNVDQTATVNIEMEVGGTTETVTVTASEAQALIHTENAALGTTVLQRQIQDLPLNGRNPLTLAGLQAGVTSSGGNRTASVNGLRGTFTNLTWDGININDNFVRTDSFFGISAPSVVSVSEFTLTTQNNGPSDGLGVAQVKLITPRGGREFHGSLFEFHRNDVFDANTFFNNRNGIAVPKLIQNQYGFNVSGPFRLPRFGEGGPSLWGKDKLFFYVYDEETKARSDASLLRTVLNSQARNGQFTYRRLDNGQLNTINLLALTGRVADPKMTNILGLTPLPNSTETGDSLNTGGFRFNSPSGSDSRLWGFRTDFDLSEKHRFELVYSRFTFNFPNDTFNDIGEVFPGLPGGGQGGPRPRGAVAWNWSPTSNLANEVRAGYTQYDANFLNREPFNDGFALTFPLAVGSTTVRYIDNPIQTFQPQGRDVLVRELIDNAIWTKGSHSFRFGGNLRLLKVLPFNDVGKIAAYTLGFSAANPNPLTAASFPGGISTTGLGNAGNLLSVISGAVVSATQTFNVTSKDSGFVPNTGELRDLRNYSLGFYINDSWRVKNNLTLNLGLRYEFQSVPTEKNGLALLPVGGLAALSNPNAVLDFHGGAGSPPFFNKDLNDFAPAISFAWDPWGSGKTSVRGGYAVSYVIDNNITTVRNAFRGNAGLVSTRTISGINGTVSGGGIVPIPAPAFQVPRTIAQNVAIDTQTALFTIDPDLRSPYVQQWNIGIEREVMRDTVAEIRYVGNHGIKLTRGIDLNQVKIFGNGFLDDFLRARSNFFNCNGVLNPTAVQCPGRQVLTVLPFLGNGGLLTNGTIINLVQAGEVGELAATYVVNRALFPAAPGLLLPTNPNAFAVDVIGNGSWSNYHGVQAELRRRLSGGLYYQINYTFSKAFSDFEGSQTSFAPYLDNGLGEVVEKSRIANDITHVFKANTVYELPFGPGKRWWSWDGVAGKILGGWSVNGILLWQSGEPLSITSGGRGTLNRRARSTVNTVNSTLSVADLQGRTGLFFNPVTGQPQLFDPALIAAVRANPNSNPFLTNPLPGTVGSLQLTPLSGPGRFNLDMSVIKRTRITENTNIEFRAEAFNVLNHTNFNIAQTASINSSSFGNVTATFDPRILQFALKFNF